MTTQKYLIQEDKEISKTIEEVIKIIAENKRNDELKKIIIKNEK